MHLLVDLLAAFIISPILDTRPRATLFVLHTGIGLFVAMAASVVAAPYTDSTNVVRLLALAAFLTYLAGIYSWAAFRGNLHAGIMANKGQARDRP